MSHRETVTIKKKSFLQYCIKQTSSFKSAVVAMTNIRQGQIQDFETGVGAPRGVKARAFQQEIF